MKTKSILSGFMMLLVLAMSSCYKEDSIIEDIITSKGKVAQIAVVWVGTTRLTTTGSAITSVTVAAGSSVNYTIEYTTETPVKEFKVYTAATSTGTQTLLTTVPASNAKYDAALRNYVVTIPVKASDTKGASVLYFAEIVTENGLASAQKSVTIRTTP
ncbi:hypothetical protein [Flectobacillus major]|jgi:hypothetical protein|uniref:hypothetical protein n=1 Tax=Flectobacillus major TaxID=103 RepID=UPI00041E620D|nr:hypothetical protein [Flectobacillus major]